MRNQSILIVEDEPTLLELFKRFLTSKGFQADTAADGEQAVALAREKEYDLGIVDLFLPAKNGMDVIGEIKQLWPDTEIIVCTGQGSMESVLDAMRLEVFEYLCKPVALEALFKSVTNALEKRSLKLENRRLFAELQQERNSLQSKINASTKALERHLEDSPLLIGESVAIRQIRQLIAEVAPSDMTVLIRGESGTGKDVVANLIHEWSGRAANGNFIKINCPAISETLLESEMFGHERGAFTGAHRDKPGRIEFAEGGTVFLDEIGTISLEFQAKLLQVIEQKKFVRVGGNKTLEVNARFIAATNANLEEMINRGHFRPDLLYRLAQYNIYMPALRERREDVPLLIEHYVRYFAAKYGQDVRTVSSDIMALLVGYDWPGNVRELLSVVTRFALSGKEEVFLDHVNMNGHGPRVESTKKIHDSEVKLILSALVETKWNRRRAAEVLGISYSTLRRKIEKYDMDTGMHHFHEGQADPAGYTDVRSN
ncbi:MAG: sigma-54-dependent Fis family transcriptional regulator [Deltaproteobacteria bacterium]|nr:sigma-54-dependent Fis family transcriptional regulator [Deltaproteobacteria bacterium]